MVLRDVALRTRQGFVQELPHAAPLILRATSLRTTSLNPRLEAGLHGARLGSVGRNIIVVIVALLLRLGGRGLNRPSHFPKE